MDIVPFEFDHLRQLQPREFEAAELCNQRPEEIRQRFQDYLNRGAAWTGVVGGQIIAVAGIILLWRGVAEIWAITTPLVTKYRKSFHQAIKYGLRRDIKVMDLHRVQVAVHEDHAVSRKWLKRLGFMEEGKMPGYGLQQETYVRLAWVRGKT